MRAPHDHLSPFAKDVQFIFCVSINIAEWIQEGCGILGAGGGGSPYPPFLMAREILRGGGTIRVVDSSDLPDDAIILRGHFMG